MKADKVDVGFRAMSRCRCRDQVDGRVLMFARGDRLGDGRDAYCRHSPYELTKVLTAKL